MKPISDLVTEWREWGPVKWAESEYGFYVDGHPVVLTPWQRAALESYEAHRHEVTTWAVSNIKKSGKTLLNAVLTQWRWLALPGQHFVAANDLDQSQARQFAMVADSVRDNPFLAGMTKVGRSELEFTATGSRLTALASDATGNAGANFLTTSHTEAWGILYENAIRAWEELTPPPGRWYGLPALRIADSYAGYLGESDTWHRVVDRGLEGQRISKEWPIYLAGGLMLFHMEGEDAQERCFRGTQAEAKVYYTEQRETLRKNSYDRMHSNIRTAGESAFVEAEKWAACKGSTPMDANSRVKLVIGADASTSGDYSSIVGCTYNHDTDRAEVKLVRVWKPKTIFGIRGGKPTIDIDETIGAAVLELHKAGQLKAVVCDIYQLHTCVLKWEKAGIRVVELNQNAGRVDSDQALYNAINAGTLRHYSDPDLDAAVRNAIARETPRGFRLDKEKATKKIDAAVALSMAHWGARIHFGRYDDSGPTWAPDPFETYDSYDLSEIIPEDLALFRRWEMQSGKPWMGHWHINAKPHPEGVTWRNCRHSNTGCLACYQETKDLSDAELGAFPDTGVPASDDFIQRQFDRYNESQEQQARADKITSIFWKNVRKNL
ncbi:MAG: hypothetical protein D9V45_12905 [Chloroflexi bacterium]|nr:MAG: hypothetical protein D9V45_12905 [Chloroflexota bacterium]